MSTPGIERMNRVLDAQHFRGEPARGRVILQELRGHMDRLIARYPDDPALAAENILEMLPAIRGRLTNLQLWADDTAHQSFAPTPDTGATV